MSPGYALAPTLLSLAAIGCGYRERGRFAAVSVEVPPSATVLGGAPVAGRACFGRGDELDDDRVIDAAVSDAIARAPGADALANAMIVDEGNCIHVRGTPVRVGPP
jgi:hypothetical protein